MSIELLNRLPEPGETGVQVNETLQLDIAALVLDTIDESATTVDLNGTPVFVGGAFQPGYAGPESASSNPQADVLRLAIDPADPLIGSTTYTIRVTTQLTGSPTTQLDQSYTFTTEDLAAPTITAVGWSLNVIRVTFSESMQAGTGEASDALLVDSYLLERVDDDTQTRFPAVSADVVAVEQVTPDVYHLTPSRTLTAGATYRLTTTAQDLAGNESLPPGNTTTFLGFQPQQPAGRDFDLWQIIVPSINKQKDKEVGDLELFIACWQEVLEDLLYEIDRFPDILDPDFAPEPILDAMLADLGNPFTFNLTVLQKRRLIRTLVPIYKQKGTDVGIVNAIRLFMGIEVIITTPYLTGGVLGTGTLGGTFVLSTGDLATIYTFIVNSPRALTDEELSRMDRIVAYMKRAPCHHRIEAPSTPVAPDHWALGLSGLGVDSILHEGP